MNVLVSVSVNSLFLQGDLVMHLVAHLWLLQEARSVFGFVTLLLEVCVAAVFAHVVRTASRVFLLQRSPVV